jgi:hypothetical protein
MQRRFDHCVRRHNPADRHDEVDVQPHHYG